MNLRDKYVALLMAFSQQEQPLSSGNIATDSVRTQLATRITASGNVSSGSGYNLYVLPIPNGANKIHLIGKAGTSLKSGTLHAVGFNNDFNANSGWADRYTNAINTNEITLNVNQNYSYMGFTLYNASLPIMYEFLR